MKNLKVHNNNVKILKVHTAILLTAVEILKVYVRVRDPINQPWIISIPGLPITPFTFWTTFIMTVTF